MASTIPWILIATIGLLIILLAVIVTRKGIKEPDFRNFFVIGVIFLSFGLIIPIVTGEPLELSALISLGLVFTIAGLVNHKKWKKPLI